MTARQSGVLVMFVVYCFGFTNGSLSNNGDAFQSALSLIMVTIAIVASLLLLYGDPDRKVKRK